MNVSANQSSVFPRNRVGDAWRGIWTQAPQYSQDRIDLPFAYPGNAQGLLEQNDTYWSVRGLQALGGKSEAQGVLEDWLSLGERYSALPGTNQLNDLGRSGMPRISALLAEASRDNPDPQFRARAYSVVEGDRRNNWCDTYFKHTPNGLNRFCDVDYSHEATLLESGGEKNRARFEGDASRFNPVELNAYLYQTEKDLEELAPADKRGEWAKTASERKDLMLETMWDAKKGFFFDVDWRSGERSSKPCLAAYSLLEVGLLDPQQQKPMVEALVKALPSFTESKSGLPGWEPGAAQPASPADLMTVVRGLERYGYADQAQDLKSRLQAHLAASPVSPNPSELGVLTCLTSPTATASAPVALMSADGLERMHTVFPQLVPQAAQVGPLDRRLDQIHPSLLEPALVQSLQRRGLTNLVYGLDQPPLNFTSGPLQLEGLNIQSPLVLSSARPAPGVLVLTPTGSDGSERLVVVKDGDRLVVGDRAYSLKDFPQGLRLPQDILQSFDLAGGNPSLERFFDNHREWLPPLADGPASQVELGAKDSWKNLYDSVAANWKQLTIEPSVTSKDTAMQIFNRAAVPSLGIFKTQFNWDTLFMSEGMKLQGQGETVSGMTDNLLYLLKSTGRVPNAARSVYLNKSQAPVLPALVRMSTPIRQEQQGAAATSRWLGSAYDLMKSDYNDFWNRPGQRGVDQIDGQKVRLSRHWGPNDKFAMDESGYDTTSRLDGHALDVVGPDLNAFLYKYSQDMGAIATDLAGQARQKGDLEASNRYQSEANVWQSECQARKEDVIRYCWDEQDGMFRDRSIKGGLLRDQDALAPTIAPLWVGMLDANNPREKRMIERSLDNLGRFEKAHGLAATAEDYGHPEMQWNGPSGWAPLHMMALEALSRYGRYEEAGRIAGKWLNLVDDVKQKEGAIMERYNVVTGGLPPVQAGRYEETQGEGPGFGWTNASVAWTLVEIVAGARAQNGRLEITPHLPPELEGQNVAVNLKAPGKQWQIEQRYSSQENSYRLKVEGDLSQGLEVTTPPLPVGLLPRLEGVRPESYTIKQLAAQDGQVCYRFNFDAQSGPLQMDLGKS